MNDRFGWMVGRILKVLMLALVGAGTGALVGRWLGSATGSAGGGWTAWGAWLGAAAGVAADIVRQTALALRLVHWLQDDRERTAPRDGGIWSELAYRAEKAFRRRDDEIARERRQRQDFLQAIEASPNGIVLLHDGVHIGWCSHRAALHMGLDPQRDLGQPLTNLVRVPAFVDHLHGREWAEPLSFIRPDGRGQLQVQLRAYGEGQVLLVSQDITERQRAEAMRRDFVANVSHEIRTPLTVLAGFVETLRTLPLKPQEQQRVLELMTQQTDRMQALVADLLTLAQLEGGQPPDPDHWIELAPLMLRVSADARALSAGRHRLTLHAGPALKLAAVEGELLSAVGNLASNAVRYTPTGGQIDLRWQRRTDGAVEIEVADSGPGIAREHLPRLTERFYRVDGSRSRETGGTGLGLAIVKHVVQRHGGDLQIESQLGVGSRFKLWLPAVRVRAPGGEGAQTQPAELT